MKKINKSNSHNNSPKVASVIGYFGFKILAPIPRKPIKYDGYLITNYEWIYYWLKLTKLKPIFKKNTLNELFDHPLKVLVRTFKKDIKNINKTAVKYFHTRASNF
jgi:hypothetical protein